MTERVFVNLYEDSVRRGKKSQALEDAVRLLSYSIEKQRLIE